MDVLPTQPLSLNAHVFGVAFHPSADEGLPLATADVTGAVKLWRRENKGEYKLIHNIVHHGNASCRAVAFSPSGQELVSASKDGRCALSDSEGKLIWTSKSFASAVGAVAWADAHSFYSADDDGGVKFWDFRQAGTAPAWEMGRPLGPGDEGDSGGCAFDVACNWTYKPRMVVAAVGTQILVGDLKQKRPVEYSIEAEADYNCCRLVQGGDLIAAGEETGVALFKVGEADAPYTKLEGHGDGVNCIVPCGDEWLTGSGDGIVRRVQLDSGATKILEALGAHVTVEHGAVSGVECIAVSPCGRFYATTSTDECVRFHCLRRYSEEESSERRGGKKRNRTSASKLHTNEFFADLQ